ncbi:mercuric reductase [Chitinophaga horti]|uniref:Mercuric reductase n=1 Tax=Chitinophaga horti TaxID=2920382 RepID=A0ABY6J1H1_9BACT|nr:mercuric reductase [Chitinophaga horti]UYQ93403.1 mercuric reductase [Chitinophaga horti]
MQETSGMKKYDAIIIGAGQAGVPLAKKLAKAGKRTAIIEKRWLGGTCVNDGCTPSKTMIGDARLAYVARQAERIGLRTEGVVDINTIIDRKTGIVENARNGIYKSMREIPNLDLMMGTATFTGPKELRVDYVSGNMEFLSADLVFINTGARAVIPEIEGINEVGCLTSTSIMELREIPEHLVIVGGGYIALEFAQLFCRLGSKVTILEKGPRILSKEDEDVATEVGTILAEEGAGVITNVQVEKVARIPGGQTVISIHTDGGQQQISCSHWLIAAGRVPNTDELNLAKAGVKTNEKGYIITDERLQTTAQDVYALGDVNGGPAFTHVAYNDHLIVLKNILEEANLSAHNRIVPYCMFTDPELGRVGMTEQEAREKGFQVKVAKLKMANSARGVESGETRGFMKAVVDEYSGQILGASILAAHGGEIVSVLQMAMMGSIPYESIRNMMFAHPTFSESLNNLFMTLDKS